MLKYPRSLSSRLMLIPAGLLVAGAALALPFRSDTVPAALTADNLRAHIVYLASEELAGRGSGTKGNETAAKYVAESFRKAGLKPVGTRKQGDSESRLDGSGYFQPFTVTTGSAKGKNNSLEATIAGAKTKYKAGVEFEPSAYAADAHAEGEVVFVGYGIQANDPKRDDYAGADVKGKIALVIAGAPTNDPHSPLSEFASTARKAMIARDKGAAGLILVLPKSDDAPNYASSQVVSESGLPILVVRRSVAEQWLKRAGRVPVSIDAAATSPTQPVSTGVRVKMSSDVEKVTKTTANVIGLLEGSDPVLKNEYVIIGAHMDHLGMGGAGSLSADKKPMIHHGADDNASGTAGVLALAQYFGTSAKRPARSIVFMCFSGEELGLLGSMHYTKNPALPIDRTVAMLNMDMIGRMKDNKLIIGGSGTSPAWSGLIDDLNKGAGFQIARSDSGFGSSDHLPFYTNHVPILFFFTGLHEDYHKPSDTYDKIAILDEERIVNMVAKCAERIASMPDKPKFAQINQTQQPSQGDQPQVSRFRVSLGSMPDYGFEGEGVRLSGVREGSAGEKAGLKEGDIIIKFGGRSILSVEEYTAALGEHKPGDVVDIVVKRGGETVTLKATLAAPGGGR